MKNYQFYLSENGEQNVSIDGVALHCQKNPSLEAKKHIQQYRAEIWQKDQIILLGLGAGHYLEQVSKHCLPHASLLVIEPHREIAQHFGEQYTSTPIKTQILSPENAECLFDNVVWAKFLAKRAPILIFPRCFAASEQKFKAILRLKNKTGPSETSSVLKFFEEESSLLDTVVFCKQLKLLREQSRERGQ